MGMASGDRRRGSSSNVEEGQLDFTAPAATSSATVLTTSLDKVVCKEHLCGRCDRERCVFLHVPRQYYQMYLRNAAGRGALVEFCKDFQVGRCGRSDCRFLHGSIEEENRMLDVASGGGAPAAAATARPPSAAEAGLAVPPIDVGGVIGAPAASVHFMPSSHKQHLQPTTTPPPPPQSIVFLNTVDGRSVCKEFVSARGCRRAVCRYAHRAFPVASAWGLPLPPPPGAPERVVGSAGVTLWASL